MAGMQASQLTVAAEILAVPGWTVELPFRSQVSSMQAVED